GPRSRLSVPARPSCRSSPTPLRFQVLLALTRGTVPAGDETDQTSIVEVVHDQRQGPACVRSANKHPIGACPFPIRNQNALVVPDLFRLPVNDLMPGEVSRVAAGIKVIIPFEPFCALWSHFSRPLFTSSSRKLVYDRTSTLWSYTSQGKYDRGRSAWKARSCSARSEERRVGKECRSR